MKPLLLFCFLINLQLYSYAQEYNNKKIYINTIKIEIENPIPDYMRFLKIIFTSKGDSSTLELINYFQNNKGDKIEVSKQIIKVGKIEDNCFTFNSPSNVDIQLLIKLRNKHSILINKTNRTRLGRKRIKLYKASPLHLRL